MQSKFSEITKRMQRELPKWFKMRRDPSSSGAQFMNIFGLQYEDIEFYLQYALDNYFIRTADLNQIDILYKATIPTSLTDEDNFVFIGNNVKLQSMNSLKEFFEGVDTRFLMRKEVYFPNPYYVDWQRKAVYFKKQYNPSQDYPEGKVTLRLMDANHHTLGEYDLQQSIHHVWNFFDEFGLLLDTPRLYGEKNRDYKERLLDVFRHPANSTKKGLEYLLARELDLWQEVKWYDGSADITLHQSNIVLDSIEVDGIKWSSEQLAYDESGRIVLYGDEAFVGVGRRIRFIAGLKIHAMHDKRDYAFQQQLYSVDRLPSAMLQYYVDVITNQVPIMWDHFIWNESFWNVADVDMSGYGSLPNFNDARFLNWKNYKG